MRKLKGELRNDKSNKIHKYTCVLVYVNDIANSNNELKGIAEEILHHHERWDGNGYPGKCAGDDIPLAAQMVAVISDFCAITERRSYREAIEKEQALEILQKNSGVRYNPQIVDIMTKISRQLR